MRTLIINLLATALLLFGASSASAYAFTLSLNPSSVGEGAVVQSDLVIVDVYLDAEPGLGLVGIAILYADDGVLLYEPGLSSVPTYILYAPASGATAASYLIPNNDPPAVWNGVNVPGSEQVLVEFLEPTFNSTTASGTGIWLATLVFHVGASPGGASILSISGSAPGTVLQSYGNDVGSTSSGTFVFTTIPEPTTALLIGFGLVGLTLAGRRKS